MLRVIAPALLAACALPAAAQHCEITRNGAVATAEINGTAATRLITEAGPAPGTLIIDPAAKKAGYAMEGDPDVGLYVYRIGQSVPGKDWREPGSIATTDAGVAVEWPRITLNGRTAPAIGVEVALLRSSVRNLISIKGDGKRDGVAVRFNDNFPVPRGFHDMNIGGADELEYFEIQDKWLTEFPTGNFVYLTLIENETKMKIASALIHYAPADARQKQLIEDVTALRAAFAAGKCS